MEAGSTQVPGRRMASAATGEDARHPRGPGGTPARRVPAAHCFSTLVQGHVDLAEARHVRRRAGISEKRIVPALAAGVWCCAAVTDATFAYKAVARDVIEQMPPWRKRFRAMCAPISCRSSRRTPSRSTERSVRRRRRRPFRSARSIEFFRVARCVKPRNAPREHAERYGELSTAGAARDRHPALVEAISERFP